MNSMFHLYGLILGVGIVTAVFACEFAFKKWQKNGFVDGSFLEGFWKVVIFASMCGIIGARLWHVITDWYLYVGSPAQILAISQGGLSILGALVGGGLGIFGYLFLKARGRFFLAIKQLPFWLDLAILGFPIGQIIGRVGNFVNQELYGLPSHLPWAIYIDPKNRVAGFEQFSTFHPLFLYEIIMLLPFVVLAWRWFFKNPKILGRGTFFAVYLAWYGFGRFLLEFLRIDKSVLDFSNSIGFSLTVGVNQIVLFCMGWVGVIGIRKTMQKISSQKIGILSMIALLAVVVAGVGFGTGSRAGSGAINQQKKTMQSSQTIQTKSETISLENLSKIKDRSKVMLVINEQEYKVEVVNTQDSLSLGLGMRDEIGSDGMLFAFDRPDQRYFWMKGMLIDLDMIWISKGVVVGITEDIPAPTLDSQFSQQDLPRYYSPGPVDMVLEVPAGFSHEKGIFTGDTLRVK